jgi:hypothetical protein
VTEIVQQAGCTRRLTAASEQPDKLTARSAHGQLIAGEASAGVRQSIGEKQ